MFRPITAARIGANQPGSGAIKLRRSPVGRVANILWVTVTAIG
jgi:hypothetical protein